MAKRAMVTGANGGLGLAIARGLVERGCHVTLLCRNVQRAAAARAELGAEQRTEVVLLDCADLDNTASVGRSLAAAGPIDVFVHNAGIWPTQREVIDDLERSFVVNHLAPFLLNRCLEKRFEKHQTRVVQISAGLVAKGRAQPEVTAQGAEFSRLRSYADTKLCNLMCSMMWAKRWQGATLNSIHPGVIRTNLGDSGGVAGWLMRQVKRFWLTPAEGAEGPLRLALAAELNGTSGGYFNQLETAELPQSAKAPALAQKLWDEAMQLTNPYVENGTWKPNKNAAPPPLNAC